MNWTKVTLRGVKLPVLLLVCGFIASVVLRKIAAVAPGADLYAGRALLTGLGVSLLAWGVFYSRLIRWERGAWHECQYCEGPVGWLRMGRVYYGKQLDDFRHCYNCGRATPATYFGRH